MCRGGAVRCGLGCAGHQGNRKGHCKVKQGKFMPMKKVLLLLQ